MSKGHLSARYQKTPDADALYRAIIEGTPAPLRCLVRLQGDVAMQLAALAKECGFSQRQLARAAGLSPTYVAEIMRGAANPTLRAIAALEAALGSEILIAPLYCEDHENF
jgi:DNA-binding phage protein